MEGNSRKGTKKAPGFAARALPDQMESFDRKGIAQIQRVGACSDRKSRATFSKHALMPNIPDKSRASVRKLRPRNKFFTSPLDEFLGAKPAALPPQRTHGCVRRWVDIGAAGRLRAHPAIYGVWGRAKASPDGRAEVHDSESFRTFTGRLAKFHDRREALVDRI